VTYESYSVEMIENLAFKQIKAISIAAIRRGI